MDREPFNNTFTPILVNTGSKLVLIDTGIGEAAFAQSKGAVGQFMPTCRPPGLIRDAVDMVIISHFHGDHVNGLLGSRQHAGVPECRDHGAGGRAQVLDGRRQYEPRARRHEGFQERSPRFRARGAQGDALRGGKELVPGITAVATLVIRRAIRRSSIASGYEGVRQADVTQRAVALRA